MPLERHHMNLIEQDPTSRPNYRIKKPTEYDLCSCGNSKRTHSQRCIECRRSHRRIVPQPTDTSIAHIGLTQGFVAIVDSRDYGWLMQHNWRALKNHGNIYAVRSVYKEDGAETAEQMHQAIFSKHRFKAPLVDHLDGNGLNNRILNLREADHRQNSMNRKITSANKTGFKGVSLQNGKPRAQIYVNRKQIFLGFAPSIIEAARLYDRKAIELYGRFARLNFPIEDYLYVAGVCATSWPSTKVIEPCVPPVVNAAVTIVADTPPDGNCELVICPFRDESGGTCAGVAVPEISPKDGWDCPNAPVAAS
jgi:hypothetical protein